MLVSSRSLASEIDTRREQYFNGRTLPDVPTTQSSTTDKAVADIPMKCLISCLESAVMP
jgi:hypothetical protein